MKPARGQILEQTQSWSKRRDEKKWFLFPYWTQIASLSQTLLPDVTFPAISVTPGFLPGHPSLSCVPSQSPLPGREDSGDSPPAALCLCQGFQNLRGITEPRKTSCPSREQIGGQAGLFSGGCSEDAEAGERKTFICFCPKQSGHLQAGKFRMLSLWKTGLPVPQHKLQQKLHFAETRVSKTLEEMKMPLWWQASLCVPLRVRVRVCACVCVPRAYVRGWAGENCLISGT